MPLPEQRWAWPFSGTSASESPAGRTRDFENNRASQGSFRSSGGYPGPVPVPVPGPSSSLRNVEPAPQILEQRELEQELGGIASLPSRRFYNPGAARRDACR